MTTTLDETFSAAVTVVAPAVEEVLVGADLSFAVSVVVDVQVRVRVRISNPPPIVPSPPVSPGGGSYDVPPEDVGVPESPKIYRVSPFWPAPTIVDGLPQPGWLPTRILIEEWGDLQVEMDGVDITWFRDAPTVPQRLGWGEPYGEEDGVLVIPRVTEFDAFSGTLAWAKRGRDVDVWHLLPDGRRVSFWHGFASAFNMDSTPNAATVMSIDLLGAFVGETGARAHQPTMKNAERDVGRILAMALSPERYSRPIPGWRFDFDAATTEITTRKRGSRSQTVLDFTDEILSTAQAAGFQWTISRAFTGDYPTGPRRYYLRPKGTHASPIQINTVSIGTPGVEFRFHADALAHPNAYYGEGTAPNGERWRNGKYPALWDNTVPPFPKRLAGHGSGPLAMGDTNDDFTTDAITVLQMELRADAWPAVQDTGVFDKATRTAVRKASRVLTGTQQSSVDADLWETIFEKASNTSRLTGNYFAPLVARTEVEKWLFYSDGSVKGRNPNYNPSILRVDVMESHGDHIEKSRAMDDVERRLGRDWQTGDWSGTMTLRIDPEERSRHDIREGSVIDARYILGQGAAGLRFHVAGKRSNFEDLDTPVELDLDMKAWDLLALRERIARNREARMSPAGSLRNLRYQNARPYKEANGWDAESGAGNVKPRTLAEGWNVIKFVGAQSGNLQALKAQTYGPATKYVMALFGAPISTTVLNTLVPAPLTQDDDDYGPFHLPKIQKRLEDLLYLESWGEPGEACGFWPGRESKDHPVTGKMIDGQALTIASEEETFMWLAIYVPHACSFKASMRIAIDD